MPRDERSLGGKIAGEATIEKTRYGTDATGMVLPMMAIRLGQGGKPT